MPQQDSLDSESYGPTALLFVPKMNTDARMHLITRAAMCLALIAMAAACGGRGGPSVAPELATRDLTVEVRNYNFYDATIYALHGGERLRLGIAQAKSNSTFTFRWDLGDLRFVIDFIGAGELLGELLPVDPGDDLVLIVGQEDHRRARRTEDRSATRNL